MGCDLKAFASAFADSFSAQIAMFPAMIQPGVGEFIEAVKNQVLWRGKCSVPAEEGICLSFCLMALNCLTELYRSRSDAEIQKL